MKTIEEKGETIHYHVIARCNNRRRRLKGKKDCYRFLAYLKEYMSKYSVIIHEYVIMPSHVHMILQVLSEERLAAYMHDVCLAFSRFYNRNHNRRGHFWKRPFWRRPILDDRYAICCLRYLHRNPLVAGLIGKAEDWPWSACATYTRGRSNKLIELHPSYGLFGGTLEERRASWRDILASDHIPIEAERMVFDGRVKTGSRRYRAAYNVVTTAMMTHLFQRTYR